MITLTPYAATITPDGSGDLDSANPSGAAQGSGYAAFDVPIIYHASTATSVPIKLVRRDGTAGALTVTVNAAAKFNEQSVSAGLNQQVIFAEDEIVKNVTLPLNNIVLDGEAHVQLTISNGPDQARFNEINTIAIIDTGTVKSGSPVLTDDAVDIIQDAIGDDTIVYIQNGNWCDPTTPGYVPRGQDGGSALYSSIDLVQNCIIRNYPGHSPIIVSPLDFTDPEIPTSPSKYGFYVTSCDYVHIYGFEMVDRIGIYTRFWVGSDPFENTYLHFHSNHCHDIYGDVNNENVGGIRIDDAINAVIFNNKIHDTYDTRTYPDDNGVNAIPYHFHSGVHGYRPNDCYIYQNTFYNVYRGVYQKHPNLTQENSHAVMRNRFSTTTFYAASFEHSGGGGPLLNNALVAENLVIDGNLMQANMYNGSSESTNMTVRNNTVTGGVMTDIDSVDGITIYSNLVDNSAAAVTWTSNGHRSFSSTYNYIDYDGYPEDTIKFLVDRNATLVTYNTVTDFRTATSTAKTILPDDGQEDNSVTGAPMFTDSGAGDYSLQVGSPYIDSGRYGLDIGAYVSGSPQIGSTL